MVNQTIHTSLFPKSFQKSMYDEMKEENKLIQESKKIFFRFLKDECEEFKHAKYLYNNIFFTMTTRKYFTLKFTNVGVELFEREYYADGSKTSEKLDLFPLIPTKDQLIFMRERFLQ